MSESANTVIDSISATDRRRYACAILGHETVAEHPEVLTSTGWIDPALCVQWLDENGWDLDSGQIPSFSSSSSFINPASQLPVVAAPLLSSHPSCPTPSALDTHPTRPTVSEPAVIVISDSEDQPPPPPPKASRKRRAPEVHDSTPTSRYGDNPIRLNQRIVADTSKVLDDAPEIWDVPRPGRPTVAYLLDLRGKQHDNKFSISTREKLSVDAYIKLQCQDSWKGSTGSSNRRPSFIPLLVDENGNEVACRYSMLYCNGIMLCSEHGDALVGHRRWEADAAERDRLITRPLQEANARERRTVSRMSANFYRTAVSKTCQAAIEGEPCNGRAVLRKYKEGPRDGKTHFIGCSNWSAYDTRTLDVHHRFTAIPHNVVEDCIVRFFAGEPIDDVNNSDDEDEDDEPEGGCQYIIHPQRGRKGESSRTCPFTHFREGRLVIGTMQQQKCEASLSIWVPMDQNDRRAVVFPRPTHHHNHPIPPSAKVPFAAQEKYRDCVTAYGFSGATPLRVDLASSTKELLNGCLPAQIHPALGANRRRRQAIKAVKQETRPYTGLQGIIAEKMKEQQLFEASNVDCRYIRSARLLHDNTHLIVCMNPYLATLIHRTPWIMIDTTFKCVHGDTNQWKLLIWVPELNMRVVAGRVWLNKADNTVYRDVWNDVFKAIEVTTGRPLLFKVFDKRGNLLAILADGEAAQAIGTGAALADQRVNNPEKSGISARTGLELLLYVYRTCWVHWCRGTEKVGLVAGSETQRRLRDFPFLDSQAARDEFDTFCSTHPKKEVRDWWAQKKMHPWLLPSISRHLTKMPLKYWDLVPSDTNALEGSHADDNRAVPTNLPIADSILLYREHDERAATRIQVALESGILPNGQKTVEHQFSAQANRRASERRKMHERAAKNDARDQLEERLKTLNLEKQALNEQLKEIKGSSPRKKRSASSRSTSSTPVPGIPPAAAKTSLTHIDPLYDTGAGPSTLYQPPYPVADPPSTTGILGTTGNLPAPPAAPSSALPSPPFHPTTYHFTPPLPIPSTDSKYYTYPNISSSSAPCFRPEFVQGSSTSSHSVYPSTYSPSEALNPAAATLTSTSADPFFFDAESPIYFY